MSLTKKDPTLRVAANDPHLVSLGGGRLSTAVTIHYIPIGDMTIGSASACSISLNGSGVRPIHCTIYRSEENEVTIVPEQDARILIDGTKLTHETNLTQGAMITIGNSNYLRFNNPAEAQLIRSAMGSNERISMPQIDFTQVPQRDSTKSFSSSNSSADGGQSIAIDSFYEEHINPMSNGQLSLSMGRESMKSALGSNKSLYNNVSLTPVDIIGFQCPKVFAADLVTVNMPAKDVLGQKYANFAKNLAENHRNDKNASPVRNNQLNNSLKGTAQQNSSGNYVNIPSTSNYIQNTNASQSGEFLAKVNNTTPLRSASGVNHHNSPAFDRYPKPGTYGGLQIYPMNGVNTEINSNSANSSPLHRLQYECSPSMQRRNLSNISTSENECLEDMLKICAEYSDRQNQSCASSLTSSPMVQNRIKTNGSLPRDKKSPFYHDISGTQLQQSFTGSNSNLNTQAHNGSVSSSSGYENVRLVNQNHLEIGGQTQVPRSPKTGYENVVIGKYVPQSPRTKIRTTCMSPKKDHSFSSAYGQAPTSSAVPPPVAPKPTKQSEYEQLIKTFEEKLKLEMQAIEESSRYQPNATKPSPVSAEHSPAKRTNKNINNLTLNLHEPSSLQNSPKLQKKPAPAPRMFSKMSLLSFNNGGGIKTSTTGSASVALHKTTAVMRSDVEEVAKTEQMISVDSDDVEQLKQKRKQLLLRVQELKNEITELQKQESEELRELDLEKALVTAEVNSVGDSVGELETQLELLQNKIHRFEAQRNATRVMEENQQAKLKQSIEMKQDQVKKLKLMLQQKPSNDCLKEELHNVSESLENDRKTFEDLEFQYLEEESEWHAYREELHNEETNLTSKIKEKRIELQHLERQDLGNTSTHAKTLKSKLVNACHALKTEQERLKAIENSICDITGELKLNSSDEDISPISSASPIQQHSNLASGVMSQSLFGSAELLCPKHTTDDIMSKSMNENMFYNNKIELPSQANVNTSTPKRKQLYVVDMDDALQSAERQTDASLRVKLDDVYDERVKFNLSLGSDDFEVNPLERRVPSQDDIDRICKVTSNAPISTKGASTRIFDSIKEIERNRQLLLAQQGHHVIEHERQKIIDLKKKCHDEARAQYLLKMNNGEKDNNSSSSSRHEMRELKNIENDETAACLNKDNQRVVTSTQKANLAVGNGATQCTHSGAFDGINKLQVEKSSQQRHSQPEFVETQVRQSPSSPRPLSEANSDLSCNLLEGDHKGTTCKSNYELSSKASPNAAKKISGNNSISADRIASGGDDTTAANKRSSVNSNETTSGGSASGSGSGSGGAHSERKRALPKHQRPLTRYLPIFSPDLNLRHHIESAGHQITLCPHVFVDAFSCRGYLHKLGATFHGWARRWFVLDRQRSAFIYYADKSERKPRGGAYFSTIDEVYLDHLNASKSGRPHCTFIVKTKKRSYHLQAASDAAARIWIDAIITGAQGNLDY